MTRLTPGRSLGLWDLTTATSNLHYRNGCSGLIDILKSTYVQTVEMGR